MYMYLDHAYIHVHVSDIFIKMIWIKYFRNIIWHIIENKSKQYTKKKKKKKNLYQKIIIVIELKY